MMPGERPLRRLLRPFERAFGCADTTEVVVNRPGEFGVEAGGVWSWHDEPSLTFDTLDQIAILAASLSGRDIDGRHPICEGTLPDGQRIHICRPSATKPGILSLTMRKPSTKVRTIDDDDFETMFNSVGAPRSRRAEVDAQLIAMKRQKDWRGLFRTAVRQRKTIAVTGATGSGKTTLLKTLMLEVPEHERIITVEDADEFGEMRQRNRVALMHTSGGQSLAKLSADDCVRSALRMRPDRIGIQEVRGADAFAFIRALAAGHPGSVTSWHSEEDNFFDALELMLRQHPSGNSIPADKMRRYLEQYIDIVVWCARGEDGFSAPFVWLKAEQNPAMLAAAE